MANLNNVSIQSAIAANASRDSYDSISSLIDTNLKKLDADVFTAHDNPAGDDMTTILNAQKNAADINARNAAAKIFQPGENFTNLTSGPGINLAQPLAETSGSRNFGDFQHGNLGDNATPLANSNLTNNAHALQEISHGRDSHLVNNNVSNYTYNQNGNDTNNGRDGFGRDGVNGTDGTNGSNGANGSNGSNGMNGANGQNGNNGTDGHGADCGCGCNDGGGNKHHGHTPQPPHQHNPQPPTNPQRPHDPHHGGGCDEPPMHGGNGGGFQLPNLLNIDILGNLAGGILHGHLGNPTDPLLNIVAGGNLLTGQDNNPSDYGRILDVVTNTNILNPGKDAPLLSNIDIGVLRGENNSPLLEVGLNGDVLHNGENLLETNLTTEFWGKDGPGLGANVINLKDVPQEKLAAIAASIAEKAFNESSAVAEDVKSTLEEALENSGPNPAQPLMQIGIALAALGTTVLATPNSTAGEIINVATGDLSQLANAAHNDLSNLAGTNLSSVIMVSEPLGIDLGSAVSSLPTNLSNVTGVAVGDVGNVTGTLVNDGGAVTGALQYDGGAAVGAVAGNLGNVADGLHGVVGTASSDVGSAIGTVNGGVGAISNEGGSIVGGVTGEVGNITGAVSGTVGNVVSTLHGDVGSITGAVTSDVGSVVNTLGGDVGSITNTLHGDLGSVVGAVTGNLSNVTSALSSDVGSVAGSLTGTVSGVTNTLGSVAGQVLHDAGVTTSVGTTSVSLVGTDLAGVHLGSGGADITLPVLSSNMPSSSLPEISISQSGLTVGSGGVTNSLSNLDPLSPFADHGTGGGVIADTGHGAVDNTHSILNNVTTITHDTTTSTDHHVVPLLHGHG